MISALPVFKLSCHSMMILTAAIQL